MNCKSCGAPLKKEGAKYCSFCGAKQTDETTTTTVPEKVSTVKQRFYWNIKPGEIAVRINEAEFINYESTRGIIINDGITAHIRANGKTIKEVHGGCYDFVDSEKVDEILEKRIGGIPGYIKSAWHWLTKWLLGEKIGDKIGENDKIGKIESIEEVFKFIQEGQLLSIVLKQDREFQLVFGEGHQELDEFSDFVPVKIRTKYHDLSMGVRACFQIVDFDEFTAFYMSDKDRVRTSLLAKMLTSVIKTTVQECLRNVEMKDVCVPKELYPVIESRLNAMDFHGIVLTSIVEISADNEDLERMRSLAKELYLSELELDHLQRTNDFKNRLNATVAEQQIREAQDEKELFVRLQEINKDKLLSEEELKRFYIVLSRERRIFEAQSNLKELEANDQIQAAIADMEKTGLIRKEDIDILKFQIQEREYQRGFSVKLMQLKDAIEYERIRTGGEQEIKLQNLKSEIELIRTQDSYKDERFNVELEQWNAKNNAELELQKKQIELQNNQATFYYDIAEKAQRSQMERYMQMERLEDELEGNAAERRRMELQMQNEQAYRMHKETEQTIRERESAHQNMSAEQIAAQRLAEMSPEAQKEYFHSLSAGKDIEQERKLREEQSEFLKQQNETIQRMGAQSMDNMQSMVNNMMNTMAAMSSNMVQNRNEQKEEYQRELHREQERHDMHQDRALNYTTRYPQSNTIIIPGNSDKTTNISSPQQGSAQPPKTQTAQQANDNQQNAKGVNEKALNGNAGTDYKECPECHKKYPKEDNFCSDCGCFI